MAHGSEWQGNYVQTKHIEVTDIQSDLFAARQIRENLFNVQNKYRICATCEQNSGIGSLVPGVNVHNNISDTFPDIAARQYAFIIYLRLKTTA